ncbi:TPA: hypothetical protein QCU60_004332 [Bacillus cereus]|nr:hypothetical protein [Bacillus cereus]HDR6312346.1 hypothetical protein [Bacillus cereus]
MEILEIKTRQELDDFPAIVFKNDSVQDVAAFFSFAKKENVHTIFCYTEKFYKDFFSIDKKDMGRFVNVEAIIKNEIFHYILEDIEIYNHNLKRFKEGADCNRVLCFYKDRIEHAIFIREEWMRNIPNKEDAMFDILVNYADDIRILEKAWEQNK